MSIMQNFGKTKSGKKKFGKRKGDPLGDRYRLGKKIAAGCMSVVYAGTRVNLGRAVAIKFLHPSLCKNAEFLKRFELEAKAMSQLSHPNCVPVIDYGITTPPFIVMELVQGQTLSELMKSGPVSTTRALLIIRQILSGLSHAHKAGIIHRDIKPKNIMITKADCAGDYVRILDFGLAKHFRENEENLTGKGRVCGTFDYFAPENIRKDDRVRMLDERTDLFSVGVVAYQLLTGTKPFVAKCPADIFHMYDIPPLPLSKACPHDDFSPKLEKIIAKAIAKNPDERYQDAEEFVAAIDGVLQMEQAWKLFVIPPPSEIQTQESYSLLPTVNEVVGERRHYPKWWNTMLVLAVICLNLWGWTKIRQNDVSGHSEHESQQTSLAGVSTETPTHIGPRAWFKHKPSLPTLHPSASNTRSMKTTSESGRTTQNAEALIRETPDDLGLQPSKSDDNVESVGRNSLTPRRKSARKHARGQLSEVNRLLRRGKTAVAAKRLESLAKKFPDDGYVQLLLGNVYSQKRFRKKALAAYERAIELQKRYSRNKILIENTVRALAHKTFHHRAASIIEQKIGKAARFYLRRASFKAYGARAQEHSIKILNKMEQKVL